MTMSRMMNHICKSLFLALVFGGYLANAQAVLYSQDFEDPAAMDWNLNTFNWDVNSFGEGNNKFVVNNQYLGGFNDPIVLPDTDPQPAPITNAPNSNYLHTVAVEADLAGFSNCNYIDVALIDPFGFPETISAEMNAGISTLGQDEVEVSFWWLGGDADPFAWGGGSLYYSVGGWWNYLAGPFNSSTWQEITIANPFLANQANLRFMFIFENGLGAVDFTGFGVDQFQVVGIQDCFVDLGPDVNLCSGDTLMLSADTIYSNYAWVELGSGDTIGTGTSIEVTEAGAYAVYIDSLVGGAPLCTEADTIIVSMRPPVEITSHSLVNVDACGESNGSIQVNSVIGGAPYQIGMPYTYQLEQISPVNSIWLNDTTNSFSDLGIGVYELTAVDSFGCVGTEMVVINEPSTVSANYTSSVECDGNGWVDIQANNTAGLPIYYSIDGGNTYFDNGGYFENLPMGQTFNVSATDSVCTTFEPVFFELSSPQIFLDSVDLVHIDCYNDVVGEITAYASGGSGAYQFTIDGSNWFSPTLTGLAAGNYDLVVQDAVGICTDTLAIELTQPDTSVLASAFIIGDYNGVGINCFGDCTGQILVQSIGGTPSVDGFSYQWMDEFGAPLVNPSANNDTIVDVCAGTYMIEVSDSLGCVATDVIEISANEPMTNYFVVDSVDCYGGEDGSVTAFASGGVAPYTYVWSGDTTQTYSGLAQGDYFVIIKDSVGCAYIDTAQIYQPTELIVHLQTDDVKCYGEQSGELDAVVIGGTAGYSYNWYHPNFPFLSDYDTPELDNVPASVGCDDLTANPNYEDYSDPYLLTVTDANGCVATDEEYLFEPCALELFQNDTMSAYCVGLAPGLNTGYASVIASGGVSDVNGNYSFVWSNSTTHEYLDDISAISNQEAGEYSVVAVDVNDCSVSLDVHIPLVPTMYSATTTDAINYCYGDNTAQATAYGFGGCGLPDGCDYTYTWVGTTFGSGAFGPIQNQTISNLQAGDYSVIIEDENGCEVIDTLTITHPEEVKFSINVEDQTCYTALAPAADGTATVNITGGFAPATYDITWSDIVPAPVVVGTATTQDNQYIINGLYNDWWEVGVVDGYGCVGTLDFGSTEQAQFEIEAGVEVSVEINQEPQVLTDVIDCYGDATGHAEVLNPNPAFLYEWYRVDSLPLINQGPITSSLDTGDFVVQATYLGLCPINSLPITLTQNPPFTIDASNSINACFNEPAGSLDLVVSGATPFHNSTQWADYNHSWSAPEYNTQGIVNENGFLHIDIDNVPAGYYSILLVDGLGCDSVYQISIDNLPPIGVTPVVSQADCHSSIATAAQLGAITTTATGGTSPYDYAWVGPNGFSSNQNGMLTDNINALQPGEYELQVTDVNGCESELTPVILAEPVLLTVSVVSESIQAVSCNGGSDGAYEVNIEGGAFPYSVSPALNGLTAGNYVVTATDANGCNNTTNLLITEPNAPLTLNANVTDANCAFDETGHIDLTVTGGTTPYAYDWSGTSNGGVELSENTEDISYVAAGPYVVSVTDANGCQETLNNTVLAPDPIEASMLHDYVIAKPAPFQVQFTNTSVGADFIDWWIDGAVDPQFSAFGDIATYIFQEAGEYEASVYAANNNGCWDTATVIISVQGLNEFNVFSPNDDGINDFFSFETYGMSNLTAIIYNRWGEKVYEMTHPDAEWNGVSLNGQEAPEGTYFYVLDAVGEDGSPYTEKGSVTIYR